MTEKLLQMMQEKGYFNQHKKVLVAVSGGADSMSLLHFLYNHQKDLDIQLGIAHVNISNGKSRSTKKIIYVIGQRNIRYLFTTAHSQESFQKMPPVLFAMIFLSEL